MDDTTDTNLSREESMSEIDIDEKKHNVMKIFLYAGNSYHGRAIIRELKSSLDVQEVAERIDTEMEKVSSEETIEVAYQPSMKYKITSCLDPLLLASVDDRLQIDQYIDSDSPEFEQTILEQDVIIYDTNFNIRSVDEALKVVKLLEKWSDNEDTNKKRFVLISNLMTWAMTEPSNTQIMDKDYRKRRPHPCYRRYLRLEQEVTNLQAKHNDKFETLVLCPGITFGYEEDILHYFFKMALYNKREIEIFEPGINDIPLIHVNDLAKIIRRVIESPPKGKRYLLGFNPHINYQKFLVETARMITGLDDVRLKVCPKERMLLIDHTLLTQRSYDKISLNLNMAASNFAEIGFESELDKIIQNTIEEYYEAHSIKPVKILIHGPPSSGKTTLAKALACYYAAYYINPDEILDDTVIRLEKMISKGREYVKNMSNNEVLVKNEFFNGMIEKTKENIGLWEDELKTVQEALVSNEEQNIKKLKEKYLLKRLQSNACTKNQGYVLDTLSYEINAVKRIFLDRLIPESNLPESNESDVSIPKQKKVSIVSNVSDTKSSNDELEPSRDSQEMIKEELRPDIFIYLRWDESILKKEDACTCKGYNDTFPVQSDASSSSTSCTLFGASISNTSTLSDEDPCRPFPDRTALDQLILNRGIKIAVAAHERKRLEGFLETEYEDRSLYTLMLDYGVIPFEIVIDLETTVDSMYMTIKEKLGPRNDYLISDLKREEERRTYEVMKLRAKEHKEAKLQAEIEAKRNAREQQLEQEFERVTAIKRKEMKQIEACSIPLRNYLLKYIVPKLTEGLVEVARVRPEDPIDYLAEYLFRNNPEGHMFDPCLSDKMAKKILDERLLEIGTSGDESCSSFCQCVYEEEDSCDDDSVRDIE